MTALAHALSLALLHFVWQGAIVAAALGFALLALGRASSTARYALSCAALAIMAILPAITAVVLYQRPAPGGAAAALAGSVVSAVAITAGAATPWLAGLQTWAVPVWFLGVLLFSLRLLWASSQVSQLRRRGEPADTTLFETIARLAQRMGLSRRVEVLLSAIADGPSVVGILKPVILLPAATILNLSAAQLEAVLAHELAHIRRYDYLVNVIQMMIEALLFYHPAVWWTSARIRRERELCCDDAAVAACGDSLGYARALAALERLRVAPPSLALASTDGPLAYRIKRLIGAAASEERSPSKLPGVLAVGLAVALLGLSINRVHGQAPAPDPPGVKVDAGSTPVLHRTPVEYPGRKTSGTVTAEVHLDAAGNVTDARILSGPDELRKPVLQSVLNWHFAPEAGGSTQTVSVTFQPPAAPSAKSEPRSAAEPAQLTQRILQEERRIIADDMQNNSCATLECSQQAARASLERVRADLEAKLRSAQGAGDPQAQEQISQALDQAKREALALSATRQQQNADATRFLEDRLRALQAEVQARQAQLNAAQQNAPTNEDTRKAELARATAQLAELRAKLEAARFAQLNAPGIPIGPLAGRVLKNINVVGLSISTDEFLAKVNLPLRVGDTLTTESIDDTITAVKKFDEHLTAIFRLEASGAANLTIMAPGGGPGGRGGRGPGASVIQTIPARPEAMSIPPGTGLEGRTVRAIRGEGLGASTSAFIPVQLPLHLGDLVTAENLNATIAAVRKSDEHLGIRWTFVESNGIEITIFAPGTAPGGRGGPGPAPEPARLLPGIVPPVVVQKVDPEYTDQARKAKWQGTVHMSVLVGKNGAPNDLRVTNALGMGLDESAMQAVGKWRFQPAMKDGQPVEALMNIEVPFRLPN